VIGGDQLQPAGERDHGARAGWGDAAHGRIAARIPAARMGGAVEVRPLVER
jgi:hypothetical protein